MTGDTVDKIAETSGIRSIPKKTLRILLFLAQGAYRKIIDLTRAVSLHLSPIISGLRRALERIGSRKKAFLKCYSLTTISNKNKDGEFLPPAQEITSLPPSPVRIALTLAICALFIIALSISWFCFVDIYAVAPGRIQPTGHSKVVQPLYIGTVRAIRVQNGTMVKSGDILLELDPTQATAEYEAARQHVFELQAQIARRKAAMAAAADGHYQPLPLIDFPADINVAIRSRESGVMAADLLQLSASLELLQAKISESLEQRQALIVTTKARANLIATLSERVRMRTNLESEGWESKSNVLDASETLDRERATQATEEGQLMAIGPAINTLKKQQAQTTAQFLSDYSQALEKAEGDMDDATQDMIKANQNLHYTRLTAPIGGTVQQLDVTTIGQVVTPGEQLMTIVPRNAHLEIEVLVSNQDVGFISIGQKAVIKIDSFPYTRYGTVSGIVSRISKDSVADSEAISAEDTQQKPVPADVSATAPVPKTQNLVYPVIVTFNTDAMNIDGKLVPLSPGMSATVEIQTGRRRVLDYILSPLVKVKSEAIHER